MLFDRRVFLTCAAVTTVAFAATSAIAAETQHVPVRENGIVGRLHFASDALKRTTVIMLNGSDGGIPSANDANDLAAAGYTVLALAYFKNWEGQPEGVPTSLNEIPLEYFFRAIDWLKTRAQVDPSRIVLMGQSRGAELALLLASMRSDIAGVVAFSPSSRIWNGVSERDTPASEIRAAWTLNGKAIPYQLSVADQTLPMRQWFERVAPQEAARIRVESIKGPVMLVSSRVDAVWPAASYADEIALQLATRRPPRPGQNLQFDDASHLLMGGGPGITKFEIPSTTYAFDFGGTPEGNTAARREAWIKTKQFLAAI